MSVKCQLVLLLLNSKKSNATQNYTRKILSCSSTTIVNRKCNVNGNASNVIIICVLKKQTIRRKLLN